VFLTFNTLLEKYVIGLITFHLLIANINIAVDSMMFLVIVTDVLISNNVL